VRCIVERAAAQSEALELLLVVALADAMLSPAFVDELPRIVPTVLEGQRDNDPERALSDTPPRCLCSTACRLRTSTRCSARCARSS
jgi:hypothetical protein